MQKENRTELYILRHGHAVDSESPAVSCDKDRFLTQKGKDRTATMCRLLKKLKCRPDVVISSSLVRARQTAEIAVQELAPDISFFEVEYLKPSADMETAVAELAKIKAGCILVIGHLPSLAHLASLLLTGKPDTDLQLKKSGVCRLSFCDAIHKGKGRLELLLSPELLKSSLVKG
ncbi:MAG: phosphohistidine phosphatase SixA [Chitinispirillaceae bacterium]